LKRKKKVKQPKKQSQKRFDFNLTLTIVSVAAAIVALMFAFQANKLSERSLVISKTQYEASSIPQFLLDTNFVLTTTDSKFKTENLWCELIGLTNFAVRPFIQFITETGKNDDVLGQENLSIKEPLLYAFAKKF
jgi:hypothetical protein